MNSYRFFIEYSKSEPDEFWIDADTYVEALDLAIEFAHEKIDGNDEDIITIKPTDWICYDENGDETDELV